MPTSEACCKVSMISASETSRSRPSPHVPSSLLASSRFALLHTCRPLSLPFVPSSLLSSVPPLLHCLWCCREPPGPPMPTSLPCTVFCDAASDMRLRLGDSSHCPMMRLFSFNVCFLLRASCLFASVSLVSRLLLFPPYGTVSSSWPLFFALYVQIMCCASHHICDF
jgi:hypothetical protein